MKLKPVHIAILEIASRGHVTLPNLTKAVNQKLHTHYGEATISARRRDCLIKNLITTVPLTIRNKIVYHYIAHPDWQRKLERLGVAA